MKKSVIVASMLAAMAPFGLQAVSLTINGVAYDADVTSFNVTQAAISISAAGLVSEILAKNGGGAGEDPPGGDTPPADPPPAEDPPLPGNCAELAHVERLKVLDWSAPSVRETISFVGVAQGETATIKSTPFFTTSNPDYVGQVSFVEGPGSFAMVREVWISSCPGTPIEEVGKNCKSSALDNAVVRWAQKSALSSCKLELNTQYYINHRISACASGRTCQGYRSVPTNGNPG